jgi:opacity protein-like surface antigen
MLCIGAADAAITHRVEQTRAGDDANSAESLASERRFYIGGNYVFSDWRDAKSDTISLKGKDTSAFDVVAGVRIYDTFRMELNYVNTRAGFGDLKLNGNSGFVNAIFDARIDSMYRPLRRQWVVPYVGFGAGAMQFKPENDAIKFENKITPAAAALAGFGIELGSRFAFDLGYRYFYGFEIKTADTKFSAVAHQFRAGARLHF